MGTTLTAAWYLHGRIHLAHVGDSRAYLLHQGRLVRLTRDHTLAQAYVDEGLLPPEAAERSGLAHVLTRALGIDRSLVVDLHTRPFHPGDRLLLCTDGLTDMVDEASMQRIVAESPDLPSCGLHLLEQALDAGGYDNVSIVLATPQVRACMSNKRSYSCRA